MAKRGSGRKCKEGQKKILLVLWYWSALKIVAIIARIVPNIARIVMMIAKIVAMFGNRGDDRKIVAIITRLPPQLFWRGASVVSLLLVFQHPIVYIMNYECMKN